MSVLGGQFRTDPMAIGRRTLADIDRNIENPPTDTPDQLVLPRGGLWKCSLAG